MKIESLILLKVSKDKIPFVLLLQKIYNNAKVSNKSDNYSIGS